MKFRIMTVLMLFSGSSLFSQVAISYFPFQSLLTISSNTENLFWVDYKVETNTYIQNLNMELSSKINFWKNEWATYYLGPGLGFNPVNYNADLPMTNGYFFDAGTRIKPISKFRNFQLVFEISPYINKEWHSGNLRTRLGIAYNFSHRVNK